MQAKYSFGVEGSSRFIRLATDVQGEVLQPFFESEDWEYAPAYFEVFAPHLARRSARRSAA